MKQLLTRSPRLSLVVGAAGVAGAGLGLVLAAVAFARRGKPLHPVGIVANAVLSVSPGPVRSGPVRSWARPLLARPLRARPLRVLPAGRGW